MMVELGVDGGVTGCHRWNPAKQTEARALGVDRMRRVCPSLTRRALQGRIREDTASTAADAPSCCGRCNVLWQG